MSAIIQISITCSGCEQNVSGFVRVEKGNRVAHLLEEALAAAHHAACYVQEDPRGQDQEGTDPGSSGSEGGAEDDPGATPASAIH